MPQQAQREEVKSARRAGHYPIPFLVEPAKMTWKPGGTSIITRIPEPESQPLEQLEEVLEFLERYPFLVSLLIDSTSIIARASEPEIQLLERLYDFRGREEVLQFLDRYSFLVPLLFEAYSEIENYFELYPQVFLEVFTDPEAIDDRQLVAFIRTNLTPNEVLNRLDWLDEEWWLDNMDRARGKFCIDVEFL